MPLKCPVRSSSSRPPEHRVASALTKGNGFPSSSRYTSQRSSTIAGSSSAAWHWGFFTATQDRVRHLLSKLASGAASRQLLHRSPTDARTVSLHPPLPTSQLEAQVAVRH